MLRFRTAGVHGRALDEEHAKKDRRGCPGPVCIEENAEALIDQDEVSDIDACEDDPDPPVCPAGEKKAQSIENIGQRSLMVEKITVRDLTGEPSS